MDNNNNNDTRSECNSSSFTPVTCSASASVSFTELVVSTIVILPVSLWVVVVNLLTLVTIARSSSGLTHNRYLYIKSLAVVDFLTGWVPIVRAVLYLTLRQAQNAATCLLTLQANRVLSTAAILHLLAISVDRYVAVTRPLRYDSIMTDRVVKTVLLVIWMGSAVVPNLAFAWPSADWVSSPCFVFIAHPAQAQILLTFLPYFTSTVLQTFIYVRIFLIARRQTSRVVDVGAVRRPSPGGLKPLRVVLLVYGTALCTYLPYMTMSVVVLTDPAYTQFRMFTITATVLVGVMFANSGMNFVIYVWRDSEFRAALRKTLGTCCGGG